jgi:hypothetical protein
MADTHWYMYVVNISLTVKNFIKQLRISQNYTTSHIARNVLKDMFCHHEHFKRSTETQIRLLNAE